MQGDSVIKQKAGHAKLHEDCEAGKNALTKFNAQLQFELCCKYTREIIEKYKEFVEKQADSSNTGKYYGKKGGKEVKHEEFQMGDYRRWETEYDSFYCNEDIWIMVAEHYGLTSDENNHQKVFQEVVRKDLEAKGYEMHFVFDPMDPDYWNELTERKKEDIFYKWEQDVYKWGYNNGVKIANEKKNKRKETIRKLCNNVITKNFGEIDDNSLKDVFAHTVFQHRLTILFGSSFLISSGICFAHIPTELCDLFITFGSISFLASICFYTCGIILHKIKNNASKELKNRKIDKKDIQVTKIFRRKQKKIKNRSKSNDYETMSTKELEDLKNYNFLDDLFYYFIGFISVVLAIGVLIATLTEGDAKKDDFVFGVMLSSLVAIAGIICIIYPLLKRKKREKIEAELAKRKDVEK